MNSPSSILSEDGPIARAIRTKLGVAFESRPEQLRLAEAVADAMEHSSHLLAEAGTGVGKSFAYLVPAILRATQKNETVLVATNTISLQEQLIEKDIPFLMDAMGLTATTGVDGASRGSTSDGDDAGSDDGADAPHRSEGTPVELTLQRESDASRRGSSDDSGAGLLRPVLVKGRGNYVSIRRLRLASERQSKLFSDAAAKRSLHAIEDWAYSTQDGTLSTLPPIERMGVWDKVQSDSGNCMGRKCPTFEHCFYQKARRRMEGANLLICNHALFFSDLALRSQDVGFLPRYDHVVLDEAHNIEDVASEHFGISLTEGRVNHLLSTLYQARSDKGYLANLLYQTPESAESVEKAIALATKAGDVSRNFFDSLLGVCRGGGGNTRGMPDPFARAKFDARAGGDGGGASGGRATARVRTAGVASNTITPVFRELSLRLKSMKESVKSEADKFELNAYALRAEGIAADAEALVSQSLDGYAYWIESGEHDDDGGAGARLRRVTFACAPVEVGPILKERLFKGECSVVLTSATMTTRTVGRDESGESGETAFSHMMSRLGCEGARTLQLGSPFDYATQARVIVDGAVDSPRGGNGGGYLDRLSARILEHVRATEGGAFVLFTSFATLNGCASRLAGELAELGLPLLAQGRDGSRAAILKRFREDPRSVLFGAASFWQGVDVQGDGLRNVIITKLPFDPPDRPLTEARNELIQARGGDPFTEDSLPRAVIKFKQGFGRLIRSREDRGRVVVLDPRLMTARYGRVFLRALPDGVVVERAEDE